MSDIDDVLSGKRQWALVHGDALELLPTLPNGCIDAVVTDPPFAISQPGVVNVGLPGKGTRIFDFFPGDDNRPETIKMVIESVRQTIRLLTSQGSAYYWLGHHEFGPVVDAFESAGFKTRFIVWVKPNPPLPPPGSGWPSAAELCIYAFRSGRIWNHNGYDPPSSNVFVADTLRYGQKNKTGHPTQKPVSLMQPLIEASSLPDSIVLDPFAGSGTTGVACILTGRRFIGFEIDEKYAELARKRLENTMPLFAEVPSVQRTIFDAQQ